MRKKVLSLFMSFVMFFGVVIIPDNGLVMSVGAVALADARDGSIQGKPSRDSIYYKNINYGGVNPYFSIANDGWVMPNCTGYAYGRAWEILREDPKLPIGDAINWWWRSEQMRFDWGETPKLGAVAVWKDDSRGWGHVAIVEKIDDNTGEVTFSHSAYEGVEWEFFTDKPVYGEKSKYNYLGRFTFERYIYLPISTISSTIPTTPPSAPTGLSMSVNESEGTALISWNPVSGATYKVIYHREGLTGATDKDYKAPYTATSYTTTGLNFNVYDWFSFSVCAVVNGVSSDWVTYHYIKGSAPIIINGINSKIIDYPHDIKIGNTEYFYNESGTTDSLTFSFDIFSLSLPDALKAQHMGYVGLDGMGWVYVDKEWINILYSNMCGWGGNSFPSVLQTGLIFSGLTINGKNIDYNGKRVEKFRIDIGCQSYSGLAYGFYKMYSMEISSDLLRVPPDVAYYRSINLASNYFKKVTVACPVDVEIYQNGNLVGRINNNLIDENIANYINIKLSGIDNDVKEIILPPFDDFTIKLIGNDNGTMDYTVCLINTDTNEILNECVYTNIELFDGKEITGIIPNNATSDYDNTVLYHLSGADSFIIKPDGSEESCDKVNVSLTCDNGLVFGSGMYDKNDEVGVIAIANYGYEFIGWFDNDTLISSDIEYNFIAINSIHLEARFKKLEYTVTFETFGANYIPSQTKEYLSLLSEFTSPTKAGYVFDGWYSDEYYYEKWYFNYGRITQDMTLYAKWADPINTVIFESNGGSSIESQNLAYGSLIEKPTTPHKDGYTFEGWFIDENCIYLWDFNNHAVIDDITLYAGWEEDTQQTTTYTVNYNLNGGTGTTPTESNKTANATFTAAPEIGITAPTGKQFKEWNTDSAGTGTVYAVGSTVTMPTNNITLYAIWEDIPVVTYTVTYNLNGGIGLTPIESNKATGATFTTASAIELTAPTGKQFKEWNTDSAGTGTAYTTGKTITMPSNNLTLYAIWEDILVTTYSVTVVSIGAGASGSDNYQEGAVVNINAGTSPAGMQFKNWTTINTDVFFENANNSTASFIMPASTVTVTANFEAISPTVTGVTINPSTVSIHKGVTYQFSATVSGTSNPEQTVSWTVTGGGAGTSITADGVLSIATIETATMLTVTVTSTVDTSKFDIATVTVSDDVPPEATVTAVSITPATITLNKGDSHSFNATVSGINYPSQSVTWEVTGGSSETNIMSDGTLTIAVEETAVTLTVIATSTIDTSQFGTAIVTINQPSTFTPVTNIAGIPTTMNLGTSLILSGIINPSEANNKTIVWSVKDAGTTGATINGNTLSATSAGTVTIIATVINGVEVSTDYTQDFIITVSAPSTGGNDGHNNGNANPNPDNSGSTVPDNSNDNNSNDNDIGTNNDDNDSNGENNKTQKNDDKNIETGSDNEDNNPENIADELNGITYNIAIGTEENPTTIGGITLPNNSIILTFSKHGDFGFDYEITITAEQLKAAGLEVEKLKLFYISDNGKVTEEKDAIIINSNGSITIKVNHASAWVLAEEAPVNTSDVVIEDDNNNFDEDNFISDNPNTGVTVGFITTFLTGGTAIMSRKRKKNRSYKR